MILLQHDSHSKYITVNPLQKLIIQVVFIQVLLLSSAVSIAQESLLLKSANRAFNAFSYEEALSKYMALYEKDSANMFFVTRIAESHLKLNDSKQAEIWFDTLVTKFEGYDNKFVFEYAQMLSKNGKYDESKYWFAKYKSLDGASETDKKISGIENIATFFSSQGKYTVTEVPFNTSDSDFGAFYYKEGIGFVSSRTRKKWIQNTYNWDRSDYLDFYYFNPNDTSLTIKKIKGLNSKYHEGPAQVYSDEQKVVFTRNGLNKTKLNRNEEGIANLQLYFSQKDTTNKWNIPAQFEHNTTQYSLGHPTISGNGDFLIFVANMPGGFGGTDLYYSKKDVAGKWSQPSNMGEVVNTTENEMFPYWSGDQLWFSSNGRDGLGGLDLYVIDFVNYEFQGSSVNLGAPINSSQDDFGLITKDGGNSGYFSSDRQGSDDIYEFVKEIVLVTGQVLTKGTNAPIPNAIVTVKDQAGKVIASTKSDANGKYDLSLSKGLSFNISSSKEGYSLDGVIEDNTLNALDQKQVKPVFLFQRFLDVVAIDIATLDTLKEAIHTVKTISNKKQITAIDGFDHRYTVDPGRYEIVSAQEGYYTLRDSLSIAEDFYGFQNYTAKLKKIVVGESIRLDNIYYDVNKATLRPESELELDKVVVFMLDNSHIKIELGSHTDSRGSASYNQKLSQRRAESATNFLIGQGINASRIVPKGYGESKVVNRCTDGVKCSAEEHQENRRTEIKILKND